MPEVLKLKKISSLFVGFSDVTPIHNFINQVHKKPSLHFNVFSQAHSQPPAYLKEALDLMSGQKKEIAFKNLKKLNSVKTPKSLRAKIVGGNLSLIQSSLKTKWELKAQNHFLFLEDISETPYRIDRMLFQLLSSGFFKSVKAVLLGDFVCKAVPQAQIKTVLTEFAKELKIPVFSNLNCGHLVKSRPLPFFTNASIELKKSAYTLKVKAPK